MQSRAIYLEACNETTEPAVETLLPAMNLNTKTHRELSCQLARIVINAGEFDPKTAKNRRWKTTDLGKEIGISGSAISRLSKTGSHPSREKFAGLMAVIEEQYRQCQKALNAETEMSDKSNAAQLKETMGIYEVALEKAHDLQTKWEQCNSSFLTPESPRPRKSKDLSLNYDWPRNARGLNALLVAAYYLWQPGDVLQNLLHRGIHHQNNDQPLAILCSDLARKWGIVDRLLRVLALLFEDTLRCRHTDEWDPDYYCIRASLFFLTPPKFPGPDMAGQRRLYCIARGDSRDKVPSNRRGNDSAAYIKISQHKEFVAARAIFEGEPQIGIGSAKSKERKELNEHTWIPIVVMAEPIKTEMLNAGLIGQNAVGALSLDLLCAKSFRESHPEEVAAFSKNCYWYKRDAPEELHISHAMRGAAAMLGELFFTEDLRSRIHKLTGRGL